MLCDRVVILSHGRVVADESLAEATAGRQLVAGWRASAQDAARAFEMAWESLGAPATTPEIEVEPALGSEVSRIRARVPEGVGVDEALAAVGEASRTAGLALVELRAGRTRLEQRFAEVTGADRVEDEEPEGAVAEPDPRAAGASADEVVAEFDGRAVEASVDEPAGVGSSDADADEGADEEDADEEDAIDEGSEGP